MTILKRRLPFDDQYSSLSSQLFELVCLRSLFTTKYTADWSDQILIKFCFLFYVGMVAREKKT